MTEFLFVLVVFVEIFFSFFLSVLNIGVSSGQLQIIYLAVCSVAYLHILIECLKNQVVFKSIFIVSIIFLLFVSFGIISTFVFESSKKEIISELLSFASMSMCCGYLSIISIIKRFSINFYRVFPYFIVLTFILLTITLVKGEVNESHLINNSNAIDYQNGSYYSAYCSILSILYVIYCLSKGKKKTKKAKIFLFVVISAISFVETILFGGRGGFILLIGGLLIVAFYGKDLINFKKVIPVSLGFICFVIILLSLNVVPGYGFERIVSFLKNASDDNRIMLYKRAIDGFKYNPIFGNGICSVYHIVGFYSHNIGTDFLCEFGLIGICVLLIIIVAFYYNVFNLCKMQECKMTVLFICVIFSFGLIKSLFSGYYLSNHMLWVSLSVFFVRGRYKKSVLSRVRKEKNELSSFVK